MVRINDRGPYMQGRVADLSYETAAVLGFADAAARRSRSPMSARRRSTATTAAC